MDSTWVVLADEGRARILELREEGRDLEEVEELNWPSAHANDADLRRDAFGRRSPPDGYGTSPSDQTMGANNAESPGLEKEHQEAERFARRVADRLAEAHRQHRYERLHIAAAPKFLGHLRKVMDQEVRASVVDELDKDLLQMDRRALTQRFFPPGSGAGRSA